LLKQDHFALTTKNRNLFGKISQYFCNDTLQLWFMAPYENLKEKRSPVITVAKMSLKNAQTLNLRAC
jgi:hypothetical protein